MDVRAFGGVFLEHCVAQVVRVVDGCCVEAGVCCEVGDIVEVPGEGRAQELARRDLRI